MLRRRGCPSKPLDPHAPPKIPSMRGRQNSRKKPARRRPIDERKSDATPSNPGPAGAVEAGGGVKGEGIERGREEREERKGESDLWGLCGNFFRSRDTHLGALIVNALSYCSY
uniref:Uncharacterized protein n=1 Tax=Leersia perrieri TaxID=77586 RepID=A0A0D9XKM0_9ORYZ